MSGGGTFISPMAPGTLNRVPATPQEQYISPSTRRNVALTASGSGISTVPHLARENDDLAEKKERRRSRMLEMQRRNITSPATPTSERRKSLPLNGLTNAQLTDHYTNCIKLSAENKINAKNAFGLHLIDLLSELIKKKDLNNFQVASSTLDASAKIYAGRVDAIHSETYRVLTGLGRGEKQHSKADEDEGNEGEEGESEEGVLPGKKRKRARRSNTIEQNLKNITVNKFHLEFEVDPLFQKTSAEFDEGGSGGLLLSHLNCFDDTSELVLDSKTIVTGNEGPLDTPQGSSPVDLMEFQEIYGHINLQPLEICPTFSDFEFSNWNRDGENPISTVMNKLGGSEHVFDLDAEPELLDLHKEPGNTDDLPLNSDDFLGEDEDNDAECAADSVSNHDILLGDGKEAKMMESAINNIKHGTIGTLMQVLSSEPGEYSYFSANLLNTWKGPEHWKLKPRSKEFGQSYSSAMGSNKIKKPRSRKALFVIDYDEAINFENKFKETRAATTLTKSTLDRYSKAKTTLPEDLHYDTDNLFRLSAKPKVMVRRQKGDSKDDIDDNIVNYNYDNENDKQNFCPSIAGGDDDEDDDHDNAEGDFLAGGIDFGAVQAEQTLSSQGSFNIPENASLADGSLLMGESLIAQPRKVAKIDIAYAKTAKKVDVKKLKYSMWNILTIPEERQELLNKSDSEGVIVNDKPVENSDGGEPGNNKNADPEKTSQPCGPTDDGVAGAHSFQSLLQDLPKRLSASMARNLSVPIAFVCLLHLANEKTLNITSDEDMSDLKISQG